VNFSHIPKFGILGCDSCFKHPMQLSHDLLYAIHMKVHNERLIAHRVRLENHVSGQVILDLATKHGQGLNVTHHLDHIGLIGLPSASSHVIQTFEMLYLSALAWFSNIPCSP
jgi:hypothetical protein